MSSKISCIKPMGFRQGSMALAGILAVALAARAQTTAVSVLDDFEAGSAQNKFLGYSYFYNDATDGGTSKVLSSAPGATASQLLVDPVKSFDAGYSSTKAIKLDFTYGTNKPKSCGGTCAYGQMVGFGTQFVPGTDDASGKPTTKTIDLTGATAITFYAKASVAMKMRVEITTTNVTDFGYFVTTLPLTTDWSRQSVALSTGLGGVAQPSWALVVPFDLTTIQKLQFSVSADDNAALTAGTVWLDSIAVQGYKWVPPNACMACIVTTPVAGALLSNLEVDSTVTPKRAANQNAAGGFWFAYNDVGTRAVTAQSQYSEIFAGVDLTNLTPTVPVLKLSPAKGVAASTAAYIGFTLGPTYTDNGSVVQPFVGLGTKTSDDFGMVMNATGSTGVEFDYNTDATSTFNWIRLEVKTNQTDLGTNPGVVHSVLLPATGGTWKTANVAWEKFSLPNWVDVPDQTVKVKVAGITKFQWAIQDAPGITGGLAIDNVMMPGLTKITTGIRAVKNGAQHGMRMAQSAGRLDVSFDLLPGVSNAKVSLVDLKGAVVASQTVSGNGLQLTSLDTRNLHSGIYSLQVRQGDVVRGAPVSLLK